MPIPVASCKFACSPSSRVGREAEHHLPLDSHLLADSTEFHMHVAPSDMVNGCKWSLFVERTQNNPPIGGLLHFGGEKNAGAHEIILFRSEGR